MFQLKLNSLSNFEGALLACFFTAMESAQSSVELPQLNAGKKTMWVLGAGLFEQRHASLKLLFILNQDILSVLVADLVLNLLSIDN